MAKFEFVILGQVVLVLALAQAKADRLVDLLYKRTAHVIRRIENNEIIYGVALPEQRELEVVKHLIENEINA